MLADLTATGDVADLDVWQEWEHVSKARRQLTWSQGIRALAGLAEEQRTDEDIAEDELGDDDLLILAPSTWHAVAPVQIELLEAAARDGVAGAVAWLDQAGLTYVVTSAGIDLLNGEGAPLWHPRQPEQVSPARVGSNQCSFRLERCWILSVGVNHGVDLWDRVRAVATCHLSAWVLLLISC